MIPTSHTIVLSWMFFSSQQIIILLRLWVCRRQRMKLKATDYLTLVAFIFVFIELASVTWLELLEVKAEEQADPNEPFEKMVPIMALSAKDMALYTKSAIVYSLSYHTVVWSAKGAFLATYYSLGEALSKPMRVVLWIGIAYTSLTYAAMVLTTLAWCRPISVMWTVRDPADPRFCTLADVSLIAFQSAFNLSTDLFILILSLVIVGSLHLQRRELAGFAFVTAIGSASILAGTAKVAVVFPTYRDISSVWSWKQKVSIIAKVEQFTAVVACCLPAFRIYLRSAKSRSAVWPKESGFTSGRGGDCGGGVSGGKTPGKGFRTSGAMELASFGGSTSEILEDRKHQETLPYSDPAAQAPDGEPSGRH